MSSMLERIAVWCILFGLSFLVESLGAEQGKAFMIIYFLVAGLSVIILIFVDFFLKERLVEDIDLLVLVFVVVMVINAFIPWIATQFFDVDYYVAFQLLTFGECLYTNPKND